MGKYKITAGQNIYDVALHIYGSIEGVTDLMVNNEELSLDTTLKSGDELIFSDDYLINPEVVAYYQTHCITPSSGERNVYPKEFSMPLMAEVFCSNAEISVDCSLSGSGSVEVDWGDNSPVECISLGRQTNITHLFDSSVGGRRRIVLYGDVLFKTLDITGVHPEEFYLLSPIEVEQFTLCDTNISLDTLPLMRETYRVKLDGLKTESLLPLLKLKKLMSLTLLRCVYKQPIVDAYLIGLVKEHDNRRNCKIELSTQPSGEYREPARDGNQTYIISSGMEAIWVLTHEEAWNEGGAWEFKINDKIYRYE
ncbi:MAG: hypothetical protein RR471_04695 [Bacteroides sp.]